MDRAGDWRFQDRQIDLFHHCNGARRFGADYNAVRMKEVADSGTFAKEFRIGDDVELKAIGVVNREMLPKTFRGLHRHSALFDHQAIPVRGGGNGASDGFDGAEVGFAVVQRGRANADKNRASLFYGYFGRGELEAARS